MTMTRNQKITIGVALIAAAGVIGAAIIQRGKRGDAATSANNSGQVFQANGNGKNEIGNQTTSGDSLVATGNSGQVFQASGNAKINVGLTKDDYEQILEGLKAVQKKKEEFLNRTFPLGYILFTATSKKQVIPLQIPMNYLKVDWASAGDIEFTGEELILTTPLIIYDYTGRNFKENGTELGPNRIGVEKSVGAASVLFQTSEFRQVLMVMEVNDDGIVLALGFQSLRPK